MEHSKLLILPESSQIKGQDWVLKLGIVRREEEQT